MKQPKLVRIDLDKQIRELVGKTDHRVLGIWAADCAERVLGYFEEKYPGDKHPRKALEVLRKWNREGVFKMSIIRKASLDAHASAREVKGKDYSAKFAARAAGQAVATAHVPTHSISTLVYAATAIREATGSLEETKKERYWQYKRLIFLNKKFGADNAGKLWRG